MKENPQIEEYKITPTSQEEKEQQDIEFQPRIDLTPEQEIEIINIIEQNLEHIEAQRAKDGSEARWEELDNQYWGIVRENPNTIFNLHQFLTLSRIRRIKSRIFQAFFESDPIFNISPRPGFAQKKGFDIAEAQEQFLDYEFDSEITIESPFKKSLHEACLKDGGILKLIWERDREWVRQRETYEGTPKGLQRFLDTYPDAEQRYPHLVEQLRNGESIDIMVDKREVVYDAPKFYHVPFKNFYIDLNTEGIEGLRKAKFFAELQVYRWDELLEEVEENRFDKEKVEQLRYTFDSEGRLAEDPNYMNETFNIFECNLFYQLSPNKKPKRIVVWYCRDKRVILRAIHYPYQHGRPYYIPLFITEEMPGWHQPGLGKILQPANLIANSVTNFLLDNAFTRNTPLLRTSPNSPVAQQLLAKTWKIGDPLIAEKGEVEAFSLSTGSLSDLIVLLKLNEHIADDISGAPSGYLSGRADPTDPDAPAQKTLLLLRETNLNIKDFIMTLIPSFQEMAYQTLQLFAQFRGTATYKLRHAIGEEKKKVFEITPEELRFRTNVTPNAMSFVFDKLNEKRENLALIKVLTENPLSRQFLEQSPRTVWNLFHILIKSWSDKWNQKVNEIWPTVEEVEKYLIKLQEQAIENVYKRKVEEAKKRKFSAGAPSAGPIVPSAESVPAGPAPGPEMPEGVETIP
ncbi:MAG: hypothetical protein DRH12_11860 [Deltaproteobacteria bacterium]|nr:MAG: hypothetical protein DRH12_11860 [Deltaproteobacteria bacterium]